MAVGRDGLDVVRLGLADRDEWAAMRKALWPDQPLAGLADEIAPMLAQGDLAAFGIRAGDGRLFGLIEVGTRSVAEGCLTSPVGYIEALWIDPALRRRGLARRLVGAAVAWSRARGYRELGSDVDIGNALSQSVHARLGFEETGRLVTYRMDLRT